MKKLVGLFICVAVMLSTICFTAFAADTPVAMIGDTAYNTVAEAIDAVEDRGEIVLVSGEISESIHTGRIDKSFTIVGAEDYATVLTGGIKVGTDNSSWPIQECVVTIKGITFKDTGVGLMDVRNVVVEDNKFENITEGNAAIYVLDQATDAAEANAIIKNNVIDGAEQGIRIRTGYNIQIIGNTVKNTQHNAITLEHASKWPANEGAVTVANNTFENWALGGEGRVVRATFGDAAAIAKEISFTGNSQVRDQEPTEEYVKITNVGTVAVNLEKNYWNSEAPNFEVIITVEGANNEVEIAEYYKADTMRNEDLNTYVAPPIQDDKNEDKNENEQQKSPANNEDDKTDNVKEDTKQDVKADKKETVKDKNNISPVTGDDIMSVVVLAISAITSLTFARKVK